MKNRTVRLLLVALLGLGLNSCEDKAASASGSGSSLSLDEVLEISRHAGRGNDRLRQMLDFVEELDEAEVEAAVDRLTNSNPAGRHYDLLPMLYHRWCELDREAALNHASSQEGNQQSVAVSAVVGWWAARDADAAWDWLESEGFKLVMASPGQSILSTIAKDDPEKALALHRDSKAIRGSSISDSPAFIYGTWALEDPAAAAARLDQEKNPSTRMSAINSILNSWSTSDPDAAWEWIVRLTRSEERQFALRFFFSQLALDDFDRTEEFLEKLASGYEKDNALEGIVSGYSFRDPVRGYQIAKNYSGGRIEDQGLLSSVFSSWAHRDPEKAFEAAKEEVSSGRNREMILGQIIQSASQKDTERAAAMLEEVGHEGDFGFAAGSIARIKAKEDIDSALAWADALPEGSGRVQAISAVFSEWARDAPGEAAALALKRAQDDPGSGLPREVLSSWGSREPAEAVAWTVANAEPDQRERLVSGLIMPWAQDDLSAAVEWVDALPEDEKALKVACLRQLANVWADRDLEEAADWLGKLEPGEERDQVIETFSSRVFHREPEVGMMWTLKIEDERKRDGSFESMARRYLASHPEKARLWIEEHPEVPTEVKDRLLKQ